MVSSVFLPAFQQSWISKAHQISGEIHHTFYYPETGTVGPTGTKSHWNLFSGTPATCVNIALHHFLQEDPVDLVISGPNFGRNSSSMFIASSGTVGAAQEASFCGKRAIAVSFAFLRDEGYGDQEVERACRIALEVIKKLVEGWPAGVQLFNINVPVFMNMPKELEVYQTFIFQNTSASLFKEKVLEDFIDLLFIYHSCSPNACPVSSLDLSL